MLKDLDQRQVEQQGSSNFTVPVTPSSSNKKIIFISLVVIILLNAAGIFVWQMYVENQTLKMSDTIEIDRVDNSVEQTISVVSDKLQPTLTSNDLSENDQLQAEKNKSIPERVLPNEAISENIVNETETSVALTNNLTNNQQ
jgi:hypothetical protein